MPLAMPGRLFVGIFGGVGAVFLAVAGWSISSDRSFAAGAVRAEGVVISAGNIPVVRFETREGAAIEFRGRVSSKPPAYTLGEKVGVLYRPEAPAEARIDGFVERWLLAAIFGGLGSVFFSIGAGFVIVSALGRARRQRARTYGRPVPAKVTAVTRDTSYSVNGKHPWVIEAEWRDEGLQETLRFRSRRLWSDPTREIQVGKQVTVWYIPDEPAVHDFELAALSP